jgi:hypothetical protein
MSGSHPTTATLLEVFVRLQPDPATLTAAIDRAVTAIENRGGRMLAAFPPEALIAELPGDRIDELSRLRGITAVQVGPFSASDLDAEVADMRFVMLAWNDRCAARAQGRAVPVGRGLSWDAPGMLPPDPPRHIREALDRRGKESESDDSGD